MGLVRAVLPFTAFRDPSERSVHFLNHTPAHIPSVLKMHFLDNYTNAVLREIKLQPVDNGLV